jgi:hypothetical protein
MTLDGEGKSCGWDGEAATKNVRRVARFWQEFAGEAAAKGHGRKLLG